MAAYPGQGLVYKDDKFPVLSKRGEAWREGVEDGALWSTLARTSRKSGRRNRAALSRLEQAMRFEGPLRLKGVHRDLEVLRRESLLPYIDAGN